MSASISMVIVYTIATTRRLGSTARVKLGMSWRTIERVAKVRAWEQARIKHSCSFSKQRIGWSHYLVTFTSLTLNNYWMRLSMISWIIKTEVCVICRSRRLRQITQTRGFDNSCYHAKTEFNNCFIIHFHIIDTQKQKRRVQPFCFWGEHSKGLSR